jgi:hypothetical protein
MAYTTPPQFVGQTSPPRQEIDWSVISEGFNLLFRHWQAYIVPGILVLVIYAPAVVIGYMPLFMAIMNNTAPDPFAAMGLLYLLLGIATLVTLFVYPGIVLYTLNVVRGVPATTSDLWIGFKDPLGYFAVMFIAGLVTFLGVFACCIGVLFTAGLMMFALPIKVATGCTASDAVSQSWNMLKSQWLMAGVFYFVVNLISQLGSYACYIGLALTMPFLYIAPTLLYCRWVGIGPVPQQADPISPYPRGQQGYGQQIGQEQPRPPEEQAPPRPEDLG